MGATKDEVQGRVYENIHNIVNTNDLVTYVAFDSWDFARYGVDRVVPTKGDANYLNYKAKMLNEFYRIPNNGGNIYWPDTSRRGASTRRTSRAATSARSSRST